ncbi:hypothetical protein AKJ16_DCAP10939 [Drosera capensis]
MGSIVIGNSGIEMKRPLPSPNSSSSSSAASSGAMKRARSAVELSQFLSDYKAMESRRDKDCDEWGAAVEARKANARKLKDVKEGLAKLKLRSRGLEKESKKLEKEAEGIRLFEGGSRF